MDEEVKAAVKKSLDSLVTLLTFPPPFRLEAAREILKYESMLRLDAARERAMLNPEVDSHLKAVGLG